MANNKATHVVTGKVRLSYVHLFTPYANANGGEAKYSTTILLPKSDISTKQRIDAAIAAAMQDGVAGKWNGVRPPMLSTPIHDGDGPRPSDGMPFSDECRGHWVFTASSKQPPQIVDYPNCNPIIAQTEIYSGIYAAVSIDFFPFNSNGKKGVGCGLGNVQKLEDGEQLGSRTNALEDFGGGSGHLQEPPPSYPQAPSPPQYASAYAAPAYPQPQPQYAPPPQTPQYAPAYPPQMQVDPITGAPLAGGIMGIG